MNLDEILDSRSGWLTCPDCVEIDGDVVLCEEHVSRKLVTKTEALRRLRQAAALVRARIYPVYAATETEARASSIAADDDLYEMASLAAAPRWMEQVRGDGYVAHLYFTSLGDWGELEDVVTVWTGTANDEPVILSR